MELQLNILFGEIKCTRKTVPKHSCDSFTGIAVGSVEKNNGGLFVRH